MSEYFREPKSTVGRVKVELDLSNCLEKNNNILQTTRFNHTMIFFKLIH